jgi:murein DD-endopeptidase MepM/ murein hydrolase activator NlpD
MRRRWLIVGALGAAAVGVVVAVAGAADPPTAGDAGASARAYAVRITVPGEQPIEEQDLTSPPPDAAGFQDTFLYPADGSVVNTGALSTTVSSTPGSDASASAASGVTTLSLFGGEITADSVSARASATTGVSGATGDYTGSGFTNLTVLGQAVPEATANQRVALADWGYAILLEEPPGPTTVGQTSGPAATAEPPDRGYHGFVTAIDVFLTADHGGLVAGSEIQVGYAETTVQPPVTPEPGVATEPTGPGLPTPAPPVPKRKHALPHRAPEPNPNGIPPVINKIPRVTPALTAGGYVFPVYGPVSYGDTFGAPRADVTWHHGDDIFAALGQPVLAVTSGTVFSVGPESIGGNRLWLRDAQGNMFYYAHLSAYSPLAVDGAQVHAGDVLGFVGNTGDARGTPYHLHFEIHPVGLLSLGYDGAVDPTSYLQAWQHQQDLSFSTATGWATGAVPGALAPQPGAILLASTDISTASGLEPGSLARAMSTRLTEGDLSALGALPAAGAARAAPHPSGDLGRG